MNDHDRTPSKSVTAYLGTVLLGLCTAFKAGPTNASTDEQPKAVTLQDYFGCWISTEPSALTIETDYTKPDGYIVRIESMMLSIEPVDSKPEFRDLVKGAFDIWSDNAKFFIYPVHVMTRKSFGLMMRKLSVTESQKSAQFPGTFSRRKLSVASANWAQVA